MVFLEKIEIIGSTILKVSFNYRLSDINCALECQLKKIDYFLKEEKNLFIL